MECDHMGTWPDVSPRLRDLVWCERCADYRIVRYVYQTRHGRRSRYVICQNMSRVRDGIKVIDLCCTLAVRHEDDHFDEAVKESWRDADHRCHNVSAGAR